MTKKFYVAYVTIAVLGLFIGVTGTIGLLSKDPYYIGAAMAGIFAGIVGISTISTLSKITKKD